jgi:hypothetical protein
MTDAPRPDLTAADWAAMRARCAHATPGPWHAAIKPHKSAVDAKKEAVSVYADGCMIYTMARDYACLEDTFLRQKRDADFIAHARTDLPLALDALARQQEANARLTAELAACAPYLKDDETPVERIERDVKDADALMTVLGQRTKELHNARSNVRVSLQEIAERDATIARLREALDRVLPIFDTWRKSLGDGAFTHSDGLRFVMMFTDSLPLTPAKEADRE